MILKDTLRDIARLQRAEIEKTNPGVPREQIKKLDIAGSHVIVLSGIRRSGKSTLLRQLMKNLQPAYYLNFEDPRLIQFDVQDFAKMDAVFQEEYGPNGIYFYDEIQNVPGWERYVRKIHDQKEKVIITGSNASLFSQELGSKLTGRHLMYELSPFSFTESLLLTKNRPSIQAFRDYMQSGGFPEFLEYRNIDILHQLFKDIIARDIITRYLVREPKTLSALAVYLMSNFGNEFSFYKLKNIFNLGSTNTVISYIHYLEESYLLFTVPRFSFSYKKHWTNQKKIYSIDQGMARANSASLSPDQGRLLENIVFLELRRQHRNIYYFKNKHECDFLIQEGNAVTAAFQVCLELNEENQQRELSGLTEAMAVTKAKIGCILTLNQHDRLGEIPVVPVWRWIVERRTGKKYGF